MQGALGFEGTTLSQSLLLVGIIMSIYYFFYSHSKYKLPKYFKALDLLLGLFTAYGVFHIIKGGNTVMLNYGGQILRIVPNYYYLKDIYISLLPIYAFFVFGKKKLLNETTIKTWTCIFIPIVIFLYFSNYQRLLFQALEIGSVQEEFTNNVSYMFISLFPALVFFRKKPLVQYILLTIFLSFILMSMKRGTILIAFICFLVFIYETYKSTGKRDKWLFVVFIMLIFLYYLSEELLQTSEYFNYRISETLEGNSSHRDILYSRLAYFYFNEANPVQIIFGSGADATLKVVGQYAHNDWLEIAVNQGVCGIIVYLVYWIFFYKSFKNVNKKDPIYIALRLILIIYFMSTLFSMSYNTIPIFSTLALGYCMSNIKQGKQDTQIVKVTRI